MYYILYIPYLRVIYIIYERSYEIYKRLCFFKRVVVCIHHIFFTPQRNYFILQSKNLPVVDHYQMKMTRLMLLPPLLMVGVLLLEMI